MQRANNQLNRLEKKAFRELPCVKRVLENIQEINNGEKIEYHYQDFKLKHYKRGLEATENSKDDLVSKIKDALKTRIENDDNDITPMTSRLLNTAGWLVAKDDVNAFDDEFVKVYEHFKIPLVNAGVTDSSNSLLEQWHTILEWATMYLSPSKIDYRVIWQQIFSSNIAKECKGALAVIELVFCLPISNAKVERLFSAMNRIKTEGRASLGEKRLNSLVRIAAEGPSAENFDVTSAMDLWAKSTQSARRPNQPDKQKPYKKRQKKEKLKRLIDIEESSNEEEEDEPPNFEIVS